MPDKSSFTSSPAPPSRTLPPAPSPPRGEQSETSEHERSDADEATLTKSAKRKSRRPKQSAAFVLGYRTFQIRDALQRKQNWHFASLEVSPLRRWVRLNLITEVGIEGGEAARGGDRADLMLVQKAGLGFQYPHYVTPFAEFQGGIGGARMEVFDRNDLIMLYTLGVDVGFQWVIGRRVFIHAAVGWIRPVLRRPGQTVRFDRAAFKVGLGF